MVLANNWKAITATKTTKLNTNADMKIVVANPILPKIVSSKQHPAQRKLSFGNFPVPCSVAVLFLHLGHFIAVGYSLEIAESWQLRTSSATVSNLTVSKSFNSSLPIASS